METWVSPITKWLFPDQTSTQGQISSLVAEPADAQQEALLILGQQPHVQQQQQLLQQSQPRPAGNELHPQEPPQLKETIGSQLNPAQQEQHDMVHTPFKIVSATKNVLESHDPSTQDVLQSGLSFVDTDSTIVANSPAASTSTKVAEQHHQQDDPKIKGSAQLEYEIPEIENRERSSLNTVVRALEWILGGAKSSMTSKTTNGELEPNVDTGDGQSQGQDTSSQDTKSRKRKTKHRKQTSLPPPRPTISRTRLKVFVGTWNMMGQMPNIRDGLTGFLDVHETAAQPIYSHHHPYDLNGRHNTHQTLSASMSAPNLLAQSSQENTPGHVEQPFKRKRRASDLFKRLRHHRSLDKENMSNRPSDSCVADSTPGILKRPFLEMNARAPYHIIAINTQECEREIREAVLFPSKLAWEKHLQTSLGPDYVMIKTETMAALHLAVFIWKPIEDLVSGNTVATGIGGIVGNKGAVAISVYLGSTSFLFVNAHLTAHQSNTQARNNDYKRIIQELQLNDAPKSSPRGWHFKGDMKLRRHYNYPPVVPPQRSKRNDKVGNNRNFGTIRNNSSSNLTGNPNVAHLYANSKATADKNNNNELNNKEPGTEGDHVESSTQSSARTEVDITDQFDYTFWAGDLNYRVDLTRAQANECIQRGDLETMLAHDQLTIQRAKGAVFNGFMEATIKFRPTYKFDPLIPIPDTRFRKIRQMTLRGRPRSMMNINAESNASYQAQTSSTLYKLENIKSCPTLPLEVNTSDVGPLPRKTTLKRSASYDERGSRRGISSNANGKELGNVFLGDSGQGDFSGTKGRDQSHLHWESQRNFVPRTIQSRQSPPPHCWSSDNLSGKVLDPIPGGDTVVIQDNSSTKLVTRSSPLEPTFVLDQATKPLNESPQSSVLLGEVECLLDRVQPVEKQREQSLISYDTSSKQRVPSWTDRILWKSTGGNFYLPAEIGDDTRSGARAVGGRGWSLLRKNRSRFGSADQLTTHIEEAEDNHQEKQQEQPEQRPVMRSFGSSSGSGSKSGSGSGSGSRPGSILKIRRKIKGSGGGSDSKPGLLESLKMELHHTGSRPRRDSEARTQMSEEDEDRAAVIVKEYNAHHDVGLFGDHRPVSATFAVRFDWSLTDRGVIGGGVLANSGIGTSRRVSNRWVPLGKALEKMPK